MWRYLHKLLPSGEFDDMGVAEGSVEEGLGVVKSLRLNVHEESDNWAILSEVSNFQELCIISFSSVPLSWGKTWKTFSFTEMFWKGFCNSDVLFISNLYDGFDQYNSISNMCPT